MAKITVTKTKTRAVRSRAAKPAVATKKTAGKKAIPAAFKKKGK